MSRVKINYSKIKGKPDYSAKYHYKMSLKEKPTYADSLTTIEVYSYDYLGIRPRRFRNMIDSSINLTEIGFGMIFIDFKPGDMDFLARKCYDYIESIEAVIKPKKK